MRASAAACRWWVVALATAAVSVGVAGCSQGPRQPVEVRTLESVLRRLAQGNDLGQQPLAFMVSAGTYTAQLAEERGFCKPGHCDFFAQLNPYRTYGNGWDALIQQGYALGDIQGWSVSSGTVVLPRAAFRAYGPHTGYLSCTVAHEIAHYRRHHVFQLSYHLHHALKDLSGDEQETASLARSRQQELEADRDAAVMVARAGFKGRVCLRDLEFMYRSIGDGSSTAPDSTHPGYEERLAAMAATYRQLEASPPAPQPATPVAFAYDSQDNLLTMSRQPH